MGWWKRGQRNGHHWGRCSSSRGRASAPRHPARHTHSHTLWAAGHKHKRGATLAPHRSVAAQSTQGGVGTVAGVGAGAHRGLEGKEQRQGSHRGLKRQKQWVGKVYGSSAYNTPHASIQGTSKSLQAGVSIQHTSFLMVRGVVQVPPAKLRQDRSQQLRREVGAAHRRTHNSTTTLCQGTQLGRAPSGVHTWLWSSRWVGSPPRHRGRCSRGSRAPSSARQG